MTEIPEYYITIHHALYSDQRVVTINNIDYPIQTTTIGCRYVDFQGVRIIQQSKYGITKWAQKRRAGAKISTARYADGAGIMHEIRIDDETIKSTKNK